MAHVLHLLGSDFRRFRVLLAGWLLLVCVLAAFDGIAPALGQDFDVALALGVTRGLLWTPVQLLGVLIVARVMHADPAVGSNPFWMTRPIGSGALLASKLTLLGLVFVGVPVLAQLALMTSYQVPALSLLRASLQAVLFRTLWLLALASIASLTASLAQFMVLAVAAAAAYSVYSTALRIYVESRASSTAVLMLAGGPQLPFRAPDPTADVVFFGLVIAAALALVATQYRTRLRRRSVAAGAAGLLLANAMAALWPWPILRPVETAPAWSGTGSAVQVHGADSITLARSGPESSNGRRGPLVGRGQLWIGGLGPGWIPSVSLIDATLSFDSGQTIRSSGTWYPEPSPVGSDYRPPLDEVARQVVQIRGLASHYPSPLPTPTLLIVREDEMGDAMPATGTYDGQFQVDLLHVEIVGTLPLRTGVVFQDGAYRLLIDALTSDPGSAVVLQGRESGVHTVFDRRPARTYWFYLRNVSASEGISGRSEPLGGDGLSISLPVPFALPLIYSLYRFPSPFDAHGVRISFPSAYSGETNEAKPTVVARRSPGVEWVAGAELVVVRAAREGSVTRRLHVPRMRVERAR